MSLKFNPPVQVARYAIFIDHGNGRGYFKSFDELGYAKLSFYRKNNLDYERIAQYDGKILENIGGDWYVLFDVKAGTTLDDLPWYKEVRNGGYWSSRTSKRARPMTREEYADFRVKVAREQWETEKENA